MIKPIEWVEGKLKIIDQSKLPGELVYLELKDHWEVARAIKAMKIRGAPLLGIAGAYAFFLGAQKIEAKNKDEFLSKLEEVYKILSTTRPTGANLFSALNRMMKRAREAELKEVKNALLEEAERIKREGEEADRLIAEYGVELIKDGFSILTYCNTGALATGGEGTALGVIKRAWQKGKRIQVFICETRPLLQGSRLTTWELKQEDIPFTLITDNSAGYLMRKGKIDCVVVGADRIAANGDVCNKIGTYTLAVLAMENAVPFYVAAPTSTIDLNCPSGEEIIIEERSPEEITQIQGILIAPEGTKAFNPAFDITPHYYISAIITERGIIKEPYIERLKSLFLEES